MPRAGWNSLPRPARSASNPEVKAGLLRMALPFVGCREASLSLVYFAAQSAKNKEKPPFGWFFFLKCRGQDGTRCLYRREARQTVPSGTASPTSRQRGGAALGTDSHVASVASRREASALGALLGMTGVWVYRHTATIRQDGVSFLTVPGETPASGRAAPPAPRRSAPAGRPGRR